MREGTPVALERDRAGGLADAPGPAEAPATAACHKNTGRTTPEVREVVPIKARQADWLVERSRDEDAIIEQAMLILKTRLKTLDGPFISGPQDAVDYLRLMLADRQRESFVVMYLNTRHQLIEVVEEFQGTIDGAAVYPREILRAALEHGAAAILLAHAHPSQNPAPSSADIAVTRKLKEALALVDIELLDHVVIGGMRFVSMSEEGMV